MEVIVIQQNSQSRFKVINLMFLSKKPAVNQGKPKQHNNKDKKILGGQGWQDDEQPQGQIPGKTQPTQSKPTLNLLQTSPSKQSQQHQKPQPITIPQTQSYFTWEQLNQRTDIIIEKDLIQQMIKPGGIRARPSDQSLLDFYKNVKGMDEGIIGSLILSKLEVNYSYSVKIKAIYLAEYLVKKSTEYYKYFSLHAEKLMRFPEPEENEENYRKSLKGLLNIIGVASPELKNQKKTEFIDPGYNTEQSNEAQKSILGNFIQQNTSKSKKPQPSKLFIGPGQSKPKPSQKKPQQISNLLDFPSTPSNPLPSNDWLI